MELWDCYDIDRVLKDGKTMERGAEYEPGDYHLVVHACVFSGDGRMLIQKRQPFKDGFSGLWDITVGGSSVSGENSRTAIHRELLEEVGIDFDFTAHRPHLTVNFKNGFDDFYIVKRDVEPEKLTLQAEEVECVRWATEEEILAMIADGTFIPYYPQLVSLLFAMRHKYGAHPIF